MKYSHVYFITIIIFKTNQISNSLPVVHSKLQSQYFDIERSQIQREVKSPNEANKPVNNESMKMKNKTISLPKNDAAKLDKKPNNEVIVTLNRNELEYLHGLVVKEIASIGRKGNTTGNVKERNIEEEGTDYKEEDKSVVTKPPNTVEQTEPKLPHRIERETVPFSKKTYKVLKQT